MKRNWIIFIIICVVTYIWMFTSQMQQVREYEALKEAYEEQQAQRAAVEEVEEREQQEERERLRRELAERLGQDLPDSPEALRDVARERREVRDSLGRLLTVETAPTFEIETDLYHVVFSELGARPIQWDIKSSQFVRNLEETEEGTRLTSVPMIPDVGDPERREFPLGFVGSVVRDFNNELFDSEELPAEGGTRVRFTSAPILDDLVAEKEFFFRDDDYVADVTIRLINGPETPKRIGRLHDRGFGIGWQGGFGEPQVAGRFAGQVNAVIAQDGSIRTRRVDSPTEPPIIVPGPVDWAGQQKKYFTTLIVPPDYVPVNSVEVSYDRRNHDPAYDERGVQGPLNVELLHPWRDLDTNETLELDYQIYVGPKNRVSLSSPAFQLAMGATEPTSLVFHRIPLGLDRIGLRPLCLGLLSLLNWLYSHLAIWGLAVIATTLVVRTLIYPLTHWAIKNQARTMIEQQRIRPEMEKIQKKFKGDPTKRNQAIMQLYRDHNVNPLGFLRGCFPILLQMPVFLALFVVFEQSVELRGQSFLWIPDLSGPDRLWDWGITLPLFGSSLNLLPLLMGATNFIQMRIMQMPATDDMQRRIQKQMMILMPIVIVVFLYQLPSGLILYWTVSNVISIGQSYMTKRIIASHMAAHEASKEAETAAATEAPAAEKKGKVRQGTVET